MSEDPAKQDEQNSSKRSKTRTEKRLPDVAHNHDKQLRILDTCVSESDRGRRAVEVKTIVEAFGSQSIANTIVFLEDIGFLEGDRKQFRVPEVSKNLYFCRQGKDSAGEKAILREVLVKTWFWETVRAALTARGALPEDDLILKLAMAANAELSARRKSLVSLVKHLLYADLLILNGDKYDFGLNASHNSSNTLKESELDESLDAGSEIKIQENAKKESISHSNPALASHQFAPIINININLASDLSDERLRKILEIVKEQLGS